MKFFIHIEYEELNDNLQKKVDKCIKENATDIDIIIRGGIFDIKYELEVPNGVKINLYKEIYEYYTLNR